MSGNVAVLLHHTVALGVEADYLDYSFSKTGVTTYGTATIYMRSRGIRPFLFYGIGHHWLSGEYYPGATPDILGYEPETFWDTRTGMGVRVGGGIRYALHKATYIDCAVLYENQHRLIDNLRISVGVKRVFSPSGSINFPSWV